MNIKYTKIHLINFTINLHFYGAVTIPFFIGWANLSYSQMFFLESCFALSALLMEIPSGIIANKIGAKNSAVFGLLLFSLAYTFLGIFKNFNIFVLAEIICGIGTSFVSGCDQALLYEALARDKKTDDKAIYFSRHHSYGLAGIVLSLPAGSLMLNFLPSSFPEVTKYTFIITAAVNLFFTLIVATLTSQNTCKAIKKEKINLKGFFTKNVLSPLILCYTIINATTYYIFWLYQPLLSKIYIGPKYYGVVASIMNVICIFLLQYVRRNDYINKFSPQLVMMSSSFLCGLFYLTLSASNSCSLILIGIFGVMAIRALCIPLINSEINHSITENRMIHLSQIGFIQKLSLLLINPLIGMLTDVSISYCLALMGCISLFFTCSLIVPKAKVYKQFILRKN